MKVISIDVGPKKGATMFDGGTKVSSVVATQLPDDCQKWSEKEPTLLCWDAPLTGPPSTGKINALEYAYSQRIIEKFFSCADTKGGRKVPPGISVRPYSGCSHWTITRASLGLPRLGRFDDPNDKLPFPLVHSVGAINPSKNCAVEIHPAVAIWLWCREERRDDNIWTYKSGKKSLNLLADLWKILLRQWAQTNVAPMTNVVGKLSVPTDDDELDAIVGWVLGMLLLEKHSSVTILGDATTGSFALPVDQKLQAAFDKFTEPLA